MPLPTSREETATSASNVHANLLNAIQDAIIAVSTRIDNLDSVRALAIPHETGYQFSGAGTYALTTPDIAGYSPGTLDTSGGILHLDVRELKPGDRVQSIILAYASSGGFPNVGGFQMAWEGRSGFTTTGGSPVTVGGVKFVTYTVDTPVALGIYEKAGGYPAMAERLRLRLTATANATVIKGIGLVYDTVAIPTDTV